MQAHIPALSIAFAKGEKRIAIDVGAVSWYKSLVCVYIYIWQRPRVYIYIALPNKKRVEIYKIIAIEMGGASRYFSIVSPSGVDWDSSDFGRKLTKPWVCYSPAFL